MSGRAHFYLGQGVVITAYAFASLFVACASFGTAHLSLHLAFMLPWNCFLAFLPTLFADAAGRFRSRAFSWTARAAWLLFWPNALYMATDFIHLANDPFLTVAEGTGGAELVYSTNLWLWAKLFLVASGFLFAAFHAVRSERMIEALLPTTVPLARRVAFRAGLSLLGGIALYLGRFVRVNSWEFFRFDLMLDKIRALGHAPLFVLGFVLLAAAFTFAILICSHAFGTRAFCTCCRPSDDSHNKRNSSVDGLLVDDRSDYQLDSPSLQSLRDQGEVRYVAGSPVRMPSLQKGAADMKREYLRANMAPIALELIFVASCFFVDSRYFVYTNFLMYSLLALYFFAKREVSLKDWLNAMKSGRSFWRYVLLTAAFLVIAFLLTGFLKGAFTGIGEGMILLKAGNWLELALFAASTMILPAVVEETFFRKSLICLRDKKTVIATTLLSMFLFALEHALTPWGIILCMVWALPLSISYSKTRNVYIPMTAHFICSVLANGPAVIAACMVMLS